MEYTNTATKGVANTGLGLGIAGTALGLLNGGGNLLGMSGMNGTRFVNQEELSLTQENAILKAQNDVNVKIVDTFNALNDKIQTFKDEQYAFNLNQATYNATNTATIGCIQNQVNALMGMTKLGIPSGNIITTTTTTA